MGKGSSKPKLTGEDMDYLKRNTSFTDKEIKRWFKGFVSTCPDGHLSKKQFVQVYKEFFPNGVAETFCEHAFRAFDSDNSGYVDFKEFLLAVNVASAGTPEQKLEWAFRMYDIDRSGTITEREIVKILEAIYQILGPEARKSNIMSPKARARLIFKKMDTNNDKELTLQEFIEGCLGDAELYRLLTNNAQK